jgi:hypothetical protein
VTAQMGVTGSGVIPRKATLEAPERPAHRRPPSYEPDEGLAFRSRRAHCSFPRGERKLDHRGLNLLLLVQPGMELAELPVSLGSPYKAVPARIGKRREGLPHHGTRGSGSGSGFSGRWLGAVVTLVCYRR